MDVNDYAGRLKDRVVLVFFVRAPPGAGSLLQWARVERYPLIPS